MQNGYLIPSVICFTTLDEMHYCFRILKFRFAFFRKKFDFVHNGNFAFQNGENRK